MELLLLYLLLLLGYEHVIANMGLVPIGIMYGADILVGNYIVQVNTRLYHLLEQTFYYTFTRIFILFMQSADFFKFYFLFLFIMSIDTYLYICIYVSCFDYQYLIKLNNRIFSCLYL